MDEKLRKVLNKINLDESYFNLFLNAKINEYKYNKDKSTATIVISNETDIPYDLYDILVDLFSKYLDDSTINLCIINSSRGPIFRRFPTRLTFTECHMDALPGRHIGR